MTARSVITPNTMTEGFAASETADIIDKTNDHVITPTKKNLLLHFHISASTNTDTIKVIAGEQPPAERKGIGDLTYTSTGGAKEVVLGPLESGRYARNDGTIRIDIAGSTIAGTIDAYEF